MKKTNILLLVFMLIVLILTAVYYCIRKAEPIDGFTQFNKDITLDLMYLRNKTFYDQSKNIDYYNGISDFDYSEIQVGDIIRFHGDFKIADYESIDGSIEKIDKWDNLTDEYYRNNDFGAIEIVDDYSKDLYCMAASNRWFYLHNKTKDKYISIVFNYPNGFMVIENGELQGYYKEKKSIYYDGMTHFYLAQDYISEKDILEMLETNKYQNIYYVGKSDDDILYHNSFK